MIGVNVSALFRAVMNEAGLPWAECERWGEQFNAEVERMEWLETDTGKQFNRTLSSWTRRERVQKGVEQ